MRGITVAVFAEAFRSIIHGKGGSDWFPGLPPNYLIIAADGAYEGLDALKINGENGRVLNMSVYSNTISEALEHDYIESRSGISSLPASCSSCSISDWCCGGSYASRFGNGRGFNNKSIYCSDMKVIFSHLGQAAANSILSDRIKDNITNKLRQLHIN